MSSLAEHAHNHAAVTRYRELLFQIDQGFCVFEMVYDADGKPVDYRFLEANSAFERHTGLRDVVGKRARELVPDLEPHWVESYARVAEEGTPLGFEQGSAAMGRWFAVNAVRVGDERSRRVALLFTDITERRQAEAALRTSEEQVRLVLESITDAFFALDRAWRFTYVNRQAEQVLDRQRSELLGEEIWSSYPGLHDSAFERAYRQAMEAGVASTVTAFYPDHERWYEVHVYPAPAGITIYFRDVTAQKLTEETLQASERRFRQLVDAMPQLAWIARGDGGGIDYMNAQWQAYTGMGAEESLRDSNQAIHSDDRAGAEAAWVEALRTGQPYELEIRLRRDDGAYRWFLVRCVPQRNEAGSITSWLGTSTDIHEQYEAARSARFLADLAELIRRTSDEATLLDQTAHALCEQLQARRCLIIDIDTESDRAVVRHEYGRDVLPVPPEYRVSDYSAATRADMEHGRAIVNHDVEHDPRTAALFETTYKPYDECAYLAVPLMRDGRWNGTLWVSDDRPRVWQPHEISLLETAAERVWLAIEKLRLDAHLRESEANFRALADNIAQFAWMADPTGFIFWYNQRWYDYTGTTLEEMQGWGWRSVHHPDHIERVVTRLQHSWDTGEPWEDTFPLRGTDGQYRWFLSRAEPIRDERGQLMRWFGTNTDVTEQRAVEEALRASRQRFRAIQDTSIDGFMLLESVRGSEGQIIDFRWRYANEAAERIVGRPRDWFLGRHMLEEMPGNREEGLFDAYVRVVETGEPWTSEFIYQHEGVDAYLRLVAAKTGDGFAVSFADLSERRRAEERIRESEERFRTLAASMPQLIWTATADGSVDYLSDQWAAYIGLPPERLHDWGWEQVVHPDDLPNTLRDWTRSIATGEPLEIKHRFCHHSGEWRWQLVRGLAITNIAGQVTKWVGTCTDIHESETREQDARFLAELSEQIRLADESDALLATVATVIGQHLHVQRCCFAEMFEAEDRWVVHRDYHVGVASLAGEYPLSAYNLGARQEMRAGKVLVVANAMTDPRSAAEYERAYEPLAVNGHIVVPLLRDDLWVWSLIVTMDQPREWTMREVGLLESVAERAWNALEKLRATAALEASEARLQLLYAQEQAARKEAEEANRLKDEFLTTLSHELRTPLTSLLGYLHLLESRPRDAAYTARTLEKIRRSAQAQAQLTDDLLDVSRIVSGKLSIQPRPIELIPVVHAALDTVRPAIEAKRLRLIVDLDPAASPIVGDANRLQQVVWNLLTNAVKFTPPGGTIEVSLEAINGAAQIAVSDTGQGIAPEFLPFVFDRFRQADGTSTRSHGGLGLGLSIVRHLVELHGGTVTADSAGEGQGSTFTVSLPLDAGDEHRRLAESPSDALTGPPPCPPELRGLRVLVVDDQPDILELLHELLIQCDAIVTLCNTAREALALVRQRRPDVLISDIAMPEADGYWLISQIRGLPTEEGGATPAIALTAYVREEERVNVLAAGYQHYVPKPIDPEALLAVVADLARAGGERSITPVG